MIEPDQLNIRNDTSDHAEDPPFALPESSEVEESSSPLTSSHTNVPQHMNILNVVTPEKRVGFHTDLPFSIFSNGDKPMKESEQGNLSSSVLNNSNPPGLTESVYTDASSASPSSACDDDSHYMLSSSLPTVTSINHQSQYVGESSAISQLQSVDLSSQHTTAFVPPSTIPSANKGNDDDVHNSQTSLRGSAGFSQLLDAANDTAEADKDSRVFLQHSSISSSGRLMPVVPEDEVLRDEDSSLISLGTLISTPPRSTSAPPSSEQDNNKATTRGGWLPSLFRYQSNEAAASLMENDLNSPLLESIASISSTSASALLSYEPSPLSIAQAREGILSNVLMSDSFEISMKLSTECSVEEMMNILANPSLLKLWCAPIHALVVTQSSEGASSYHSASASSEQQQEQQQGREYEGEWIEATTASLESPPSNISFLESASQAVLDTLGFSSYGSVRMFIERRRGQVGLTVGPFSGGIHAAHKFTVEQGPDGFVRVMDRVRLTKHEEDLGIVSSMFLCGMMDSLECCLLPSVSAYMEQTVESLAKLRVLSQNERLRGGNLPAV